MTRSLVDLLWRDHPDAPAGGTRGPRAKHSTGEVVSLALEIADGDGLDAVTVRALASALAVAPMSVYTHVNSHDDLLVLMADTAYAEMALPAYGRAGWRTRVSRVAHANLDLLRARPWLLRVRDPRTALGPGTIAKYDHELRAFDRTSLDDLQRDAALTLVLDFARAAAADLTADASDFGDSWEQAAGPLAHYLGESFPVAQRVGQVAGEALQGPYDAEHAWRFGLERILAGLAELIDR